MKSESVHAAFKREAEERILGYKSDQAWQSVSADWVRHAFAQRYMYNFFTMGRPIIQLPTDILAVQEAVGARQFGQAYLVGRVVISEIARIHDLHAPDRLSVLLLRHQIEIPEYPAERVGL